MVTVQGPDREREERLTALVRAHQTALLRLCYAYLHDQTLAEDAVQDTFLKAFLGFDSFRGEANEKTWLSRIAVNCCRDKLKSGWFRHVNRRVTPEMLPEGAEERTETDETLTAEIMNLPVRLRECILLYYFEDMNTVEIAQTLHISQQAVSSRMQRAMKKLRSTLERGRTEND